MGGQHPRLGVEPAEQASGTAPLGLRQLVGPLVAQKVGTADAVEQHGPARANITWCPGRAGQQVGEVVRGMARRGQGRDREGAGGDLGTIAEGRAFPGEAEVLAFGHDVGGAQPAGQVQAPAQIVVVDVRLQDMGDADPQGLGRLQVAVGLALRVDHDGYLAVVDQVAPVPEPCRLEADGLGPCRGGQGQGRPRQAIGAGVVVKGRTCHVHRSLRCSVTSSAGQ